MSKLEVALPSDREIVITRVLNAPKALAFRAFTEPALLAQWCTGPDGWTMPTCEFPAKAPGPFRYVFRNTADAQEMTIQGTVKELTPTDRIVHIERWGPEWPEALNTTTFEARGAQTVVTVTVRYPTKEARDAALKTGMADGMEMSYARLDGLASGWA